MVRLSDAEHPEHFLAEQFTEPEPPKPDLEAKLRQLQDELDAWESHKAQMSLQAGEIPAAVMMAMMFPIERQIESLKRRVVELMGELLAQMPGEKGKPK